MTEQRSIAYVGDGNLSDLTGYLLDRGAFEYLAHDLDGIIKIIAGGSFDLVFVMLHPLNRYHKHPVEIVDIIRSLQPNAILCAGDRYDDRHELRDAGFDYLYPFDWTDGFYVPQFIAAALDRGLTAFTSLDDLHQLAEAYRAHEQERQRDEEEHERQDRTGQEYRDWIDDARHGRHDWL